MGARNTLGVVSRSSQDLHTSGCTEVHRRRNARPTLSTFSTGTAQTLGEHKGAPSAGQPPQSSAVTARLRNRDSSSPVPAVPAHPFERSHSGPLRGGGEGGTAATRPFHPTQAAAAASARFPNPGGSRCVVQPGPERLEGARRHHQSRRPPARSAARRTLIPVREGDRGPSGTAAAAPPQLAQGRRGRGGGNGAGEGGTRRVGNSHGRRTALPLRDRHRRHPAHRIASRNNSPARPATPAAARTHTPQPEHPGSHGHTPGQTQRHADRHGRTDNTDTRGRAPAPLPVTVGGGSGGRRGSARLLTVTVRPVTAATQPRAPPARAPAPALTAEVMDELGVAGAARLPGHR